MTEWDEWVCEKKQHLALLEEVHRLKLQKLQHFPIDCISPHIFTSQFSILTFIYIHIFCSFCSFCSLRTENACGTGLFSFVKEFVLL